jgi:hypothetical protein
LKNFLRIGGVNCRKKKKEEGRRKKEEGRTGLTQNLIM